MAKKVKLYISSDLRSIWREALQGLNYSEGTEEELAECSLVVLELSDSYKAAPIETVLKAEGVNVVVIADFDSAASHRLDQLKSMVVGLCDRSDARDFKKVIRYLEIGLTLTKTLASYRDQKLIWSAKGSLMENYHLSEADAHRRLQTASMKTGRSLREIARAVLTADEVARLK